MIPPWLLLFLTFSPSGYSSAPTSEPTVELIESWPRGTNLDHADLRDASVVWLEAFDAAKTSIDLAQFYLSEEPGAGPASTLGAIVSAIERAAARGVKVRGLFDAKFYKTYPETIDRLGHAKSVETRLLDLKPVTGGVLHAKYFVVDGQVTYLGSQNMDWRSLEHIQELGVLVDSKPVAATFLEAFELDWRIAGGDKRTEQGSKAADGFPLRVGAGSEEFRITPVYSPLELAPDPRLWDLPRLVSLIDGAKQSVRVQLLTYRMTGRDGTYFEELENALRRAAARGVKVQLLLADWCMRKGTIEGLQALEPLANVEVKLVTIPQSGEGFVPFARVIHAKYLAVDGRAAWVGTSNWEKDYFHESRNVGVVIEGGPLPRRLDQFFLDGWNGPYAKPVDPCATYVAPRIGE
ncbi:MAG: phospholipase D-like domain-containing protein [Planctomycetota bacterium]|nr:phospholipase D-like domain-containing protein [Planctomycetota bacterium]